MSCSAPTAPSRPGRTAQSRADAGFIARSPRADSPLRPGRARSSTTSSVSACSSCPRDEIVMAPVSRRRPRGVLAGKRATDMNYTIFPSPLGSVLVAASERGITWMGFGDSDEDALAEIRIDFPMAELTRDGRGSELRRYGDAIAAFLERRFSFPTLPLDLIGTPFQRRVWDELCEIPHGTTRSYGEIARRVGRPDAPRAVGAAVGANPVSILVPCHRAVAADGSLHNYRYGIERKRALLDIEGVPLRDGRDPQRTLSLGRAG